MRAPGQVVEMEVRLAARALARHGLVHAYGHVSARVDMARFVVTPAHPLGRLSLTTRLVACAVEEPLPEAALPEVRLHQEIYRARPDVGAVCRFQSPKVIALSAIRRTPRALHGLGRVLRARAAAVDDPLLVRDSERAVRVAHLLADARAIVLRGNGAVTVGVTAREAAAHAFFLEDAATMELHVLSSGARAVPYTAEQAVQRAAPDKRLYDRMWEFLLGDDAAPTEVQS